MGSLIVKAGFFFVSISRSIPMISGVDVYNMSWNSPGPSFPGFKNVMVNFSGCNFDAYRIVTGVAGTGVKICTVTCPSEGITEAVARQQCNGTGCCSTSFDNSFGETIPNLNFRFVRRPEAEAAEPSSNRSRSSLTWDRIDVQTTNMALAWALVDAQTCGAALENKSSYACVSENSNCVDQLPGYLCQCNGGYSGNPYVQSGCSRDLAPRKENCRRLCGNISIPFPFGLEEGCCARKEFLLYCNDDRTLLSTQFIFMLDQDYASVSYINISGGIIVTKSNSTYTISGSLYRSSMITQDFNWAVANLSCHEAQQDTATYACISANSACLVVNSTHNVNGFLYMGYRCICKAGFEGNPYVPNGCQDVDECATGICRGLCHNTNGNYSCTDCPYNTQYDATVMQCIKEKRKLSLLLGIAIGFGAGFGILLLCLCTILFVLRWKRDAQNKLRRKYFRENKGMLLEQLISADENANDKTKIFSLEELEKATNNFDETRVLGRGGHGTVYKGILSDQRVVAVEVSKVIEKCEINQFINEVAILSQISHRNIVKLFGCCLETKVPLLVYDFVPNGSLYNILHPCSETTFSLSWNNCLRIAAEAAGALHYLHSSASVSVFHRDVKSSNILLDANYTAKVSDFGASRLVPIDQTHVDTLVQGTFGYLDPEYYHTGQLNEKSDVYSFGVVLVELLIRRKPIFTSDTGFNQNLSSYFLSELKSRPIEEVVAAEIRKEATNEEINSVASLAEMCLKLRGEDRPTMKQVEMTLHNLHCEARGKLIA